MANVAILLSQPSWHYIVELIAQRAGYGDVEIGPLSWLLPKSITDRPKVTNSRRAVGSANTSRDVSSLHFSDWGR